MSANSLRLEDVKFRSVMRKHTSSIFVGYADATLVVPNALPGGEAFMLRIRAIELKIVRSADGTSDVRIDFKSEQGRNGEWYPIMFPKSAETRAALTNAILNDRFVNAVITTLLEDIDAGRETFAA